MGLSEGARQRIGKGTLSGRVVYSPDGTRLAVASSIGVWIYDANTGEELALFTGTHRASLVSRFPRRMEKIVASGAARKMELVASRLAKFGCGTRIPASILLR